MRWWPWHNIRDQQSKGAKELNVGCVNLAPDISGGLMAFDVADNLNRLRKILDNHAGESAVWIEQLIPLVGTDSTELYRQLNSKHMWGGACSVASEALAENPGIDDWQWQTEIREFRGLMIELAQHLQSRGDVYPDVGTWMAAFSNWNQSEI